MSSSWKKDFPSLLDVVKQMNTYEKALISQVIDLFKLILVLPATNASSETFYRLNHLMILSAYKENVDKLSLKDVAREFIHKNDTRISLFGKM